MSTGGQHESEDIPCLVLADEPWVRCLVSTFKIGDIVRLKSGGPAMTVVEVPARLPLNDMRSDLLARVTWADRQHVLHESVLLTVALQLVVPQVDAAPVHPSTARGAEFKVRQLAVNRCAFTGSHVFDLGMPTCRCGEVISPGTPAVATIQATQPPFSAHVPPAMAALDPHDRATVKRPPIDPDLRSTQDVKPVCMRCCIDGVDVCVCETVGRA
jgi:uncharacterized protein YodC (DUF2158 family)